MKKTGLILSLLSVAMFGAAAQEIRMTATAPLTGIYGETCESDELLPMNEIGVDFGYALYETQISVISDDALLEIEHVRDYAAVYANGRLQGTMTDGRKSLPLDLAPGDYTLQLYVENIGRITYGPEILDNSKGVFGRATIDGEEVAGWRIIPLNVRECDVSALAFSPSATVTTPSFHRGAFQTDSPTDVYLDMSGWGMGEVWLNGHYLGSFWEEEKQQSILVSAELLKSGINEVVVFDLKRCGGGMLRLSSAPVFK